MENNEKTEWDHIYVGPFNHYVHNVDHHNCIIEATWQFTWSDCLGQTKAGSLEYQVLQFNIICQCKVVDYAPFGWVKWNSPQNLVPRLHMDYTPSVCKGKMLPIKMTADCFQYNWTDRTVHQSRYSPALLKALGLNLNPGDLWANLNCLSMAWDLDLNVRPAGILYFYVLC